MVFNELNDHDTALPVCIKEIDISRLYGLIRLQVIIEDRRPDFNEYEKKFKTQIRLKLFFYSFSLIAHSKNPPTIIVNNTEDNYDLVYMCKLATKKAKVW